MAVTPHVYAKLNDSLWNAKINVGADTFKCVLLSAYTPGVHQYLSDVLGAGTEASGTGYTSGGLALTSPTLTTTAAASWATSRVNSTAQVVGDIVRPATSNGYLDQCVVAGTTASSVPTYPPTVGGEVTDGGVTWLCIGTAASVFTTGTALSWNAAGGSLAAAFAVFADTTPSTNATRPVLGYWDLGGTQTATGGTFVLTPNASAGLLAFPSS